MFGVKKVLLCRVDRIIKATVTTPPVPATGELGETRKHFECEREGDGLVLHCISAAGCQDGIPGDLKVGERVLLVERSPAVLVGPPEPESWVCVEAVKRAPAKATKHTFHLPGDGAVYTVTSKEPVSADAAALAFGRWAEEHGSVLYSAMEKAIGIEYETWRDPRF